eukprot:scaffold451_cov184-Amphora_coffeaeformis.AAC.4
MHPPTRRVSLSLGDGWFFLSLLLVLGGAQECRCFPVVLSSGIGAVASSFKSLPYISGQSLRPTLCCWAAAVEGEHDEPQPPPPTPCQRICRYNANFFDGQVCIGCYREPYEIGAWETGLSPQEKAWALYDAAERVPTTNDDADAVFGGAISRDELEHQARAWEYRAKEPS